MNQQTIREIFERKDALETKILNFCEKRLHQGHEFIVLDNGVERKEIIPYWCCKIKSPYKKECGREIKGKDENDFSECPACANVVYKYIIFDLSEESVRRSLNEYVFKNNESFNYFQNISISNMFFGENDYVRFNTYILFVASQSNQFAGNLEAIRNYVEGDLDYARKKYILIENLVEFATLPQPANNTKPSYIGEYKEHIRPIVKALLDVGMAGFLVDSDDDVKCKERLLTHIENKGKRNSDTYDQSMQDDGALGFEGIDSFIAEYYGNISTTNIDKANRLRLECVEIKNYRKYLHLEENIKFKKMTLMYEKNRTGKTSVLDGIANAFVGADANSPLENDATFEAFLLDDDEAPYSFTFTADKSDGKNKKKLFHIGKESSGKAKKNRRIIIEQRKQEFYPRHYGELSSLFRALNYFELDAVAKFAMGDDTLRRLFANETIDRFCRRTKLLNETLVSVLKEYEDNIAPDEAVNSVKNPENSWKVNQGILKDKKDYCEKALNKIKDKIKNIPEYNWIEDMENNLDVMKKIYHKLHSFDEDIVIVDGDLRVKDNRAQNGGGNAKTRLELSAAQRACVALAAVFSQFLKGDFKLDFMLLDEPMANLDDLHLLNLFDLLRDLTIVGHQIVLATASSTFNDIANVKFNCLGDQYKCVQIVEPE